MNLKHLAITLTSTLACLSSQADVLVGWDIAGLSVASDLTADIYALGASTTGLGIADATLTLSNTVNPSTATSRYGFKIGTNDQTTSLNDAIAAGHFIQFNLTASPGYMLSLTSLEMLGQSSGTGADSIAVLSNIGGFTAGSELASVSGISGPTGGFDTDSSGFGAPIDLSDSAYQGIEAVSFRIYGWDTTSAAGSTSLRSLTGDDLVINGSATAIVAIPEASTGLVLSAILSLSMIGSRRR